MNLDAHLVRWHGATTAELLDADGASKTDIQSWIRAGKLIRVRKGTYVAPVPAKEKPAREVIAVARTYPGACLLGKSALLTRGIPVLRQQKLRVDLGRAGQQQSWASSRRDVLVSRYDGPLEQIPQWPDVCSSPLTHAIVRTARQDEKSGLMAANAALHKGLVTADGLLAASPVGLPGSKAARHVLSLAHELIESPGESMCWYWFHALGMEVEPQVEIFDAQGFVGRVDFLDRDSQTVYEFDGKVKYAGCDGADALMKEKRREDRLWRTGHRVVRLIWRDVMSLDAFLREIRVDSGLRRLWQTAS